MAPENLAEPCRGDRTPSIPFVADRLPDNNKRWRHLCCDLLPFRAQLRRGGKAVHLRSFATAEEQEAALCAIARAAYNLLSVCR